MEVSITEKIKKAYTILREQMWEKYKRHVSFGDLFTDRWETAKAYGFGEGTSCYDNVLILGEVRVGKNTWIGPNCILDGSGGLEIGDYCSISAGVQIYSHHTVKWATSLGNESTETDAVKIGSGVYIGPQSVIQMGVSIGDKAVIGACSFVNRDVPSNTKVWGSPARIQDSN
ncbi:MAG: acyltransferase [Candidatus Ruthia sp.]|nr:acyltransferase [Candidatus Ruthturnera sp.]